jgi:predicted nucleotidyltransferase
MNAQTKILNKGTASPSHTSTLNPGLCKQYYKLFSKNFGKPPSTKDKANDSSINQSFKLTQINYNDLLSSKDSSHTKSEVRLQEEVSRWFFSLDLPLRIKLSSIESKFIGNLLQQLYQHTVLDSKVKFQIKPSQNSKNKDESEEVYPFVYNNTNSVSFFNLNLANFSSRDFNHRDKDTKENVNHYLNYFTPNNYVQTNIVLNNYLKMNESMEKEFLKEIKFYKIEDLNDTFMPSMKLLQNEDLFKKFLGYFSNDKFFTKLIQPDFDQSPNTGKSYNLSLPSWVNFKDHYSFCQILSAYFEQTILIWFLFSKKLDKESFIKLVQNLSHEKKIDELIEDINKVVNFLKKKIQSNSDKKNLIDELDLRSLCLQIRKDQVISEMISNKRRFSESVYNNCYNNPYFHHPYDRRTIMEVLDEAESIVKGNLYTMTEGPFVESLLFTNFNKIFTYEDFLTKKIYDEIHNLYTKQNAEDLFEELVIGDEKGNKKNMNSPKKGKVIKTVKKRKSKTNNDEEINNNKMKNEIVNSILDEMLIKALKENNKREALKKEKEMKMLKDSEKDNSSLVPEKISTVKSKRKEKNSFFLYNVNPSQRNSRKNSKINEKDKENQVPLASLVALKEKDRENLTTAPSVKLLNSPKNVIEKEKAHRNSFNKPTSPNKNLVNNKESTNINDNENEKEKEKEKENNLIINNTINNTIIPNNNPLESLRYDVSSSLSLANNLKEKFSNPISNSRSRFNSYHTEERKSDKDKCNINNTYLGSASIQDENFKSIIVNKTQDKISPKNENINNTSSNNTLSNNNTHLITSNLEIEIKKEEKLLETNFKEKIQIQNNLLINNESESEESKLHIHNQAENNHNNHNNLQDKNEKNINITINSPIYNNYFIINSPTNTFFPPQPRFTPTSHKSNYPNRNLSSSFNNNLYSNPHLTYPNYSPYPSYFTPSHTQRQFLAHQDTDYHYKILLHNALHNDILSYSRDVNENVMALKGIKISIIQKLEEIIKTSLGEYSINLNLYGSFATDLEIESSDIDITVKYHSKSDENYNNFQTEFLINRLVKTFLSKELFENVNPIYTASVPVIKLLIDMNKSEGLLDASERKVLEAFREGERYRLYKFNCEELNKVRIDLTFHNVNGSGSVSGVNGLSNFTPRMSESPSQQAVEFIKNYLICFPEIRPLIHVLKRLLQVEKLNSSFNGKNGI